MMKKEYTFSVADSLFSVSFRNDDDALIGSMQQYEPFEQRETTGKPCFTLDVLEKSAARQCAVENFGTALLDLHEEGLRIRIYNRCDDEVDVWLGLDAEPYARCLIHTDTSFATATLAVDGSPTMRLFGLNNALMMLFAFNGARRNILLLHASVVVWHQRGYLFLGKSGTGKSTHSALWLKHIPDTYLLNDDNPVVRIGDDGKVRVYGSPWSGKTPCYKQQHVQAGGFVRLWQAPYNRIEHLSAVKAYAALLPAISSMKWERSLSDGIHRTLNEVVKAVPVFRLDCLPDEAAARMSFEALTAEEDDK